METEEAAKEPPNVPDSDEEDVDQMLADEGFGAETTDILGMLTGKPEKEDILHYAIPVVAPFNSVRSYKVSRLLLICIKLKIELLSSN